jgi:D-inositol-3-phosphate glycosyltransferase
VEQETVNCCDLILASTHGEREQFAELYRADEARIEVVPPGVDHDVFAAGSSEQRRADRAALGLTDGTALLFAGRLQPLKGAGLAVRTLAELDDPGAVLLIVGGPSGPDGETELARIHGLVRSLGLTNQVRFVPPQPHERLARFYRAVDVCLVPSRSESFGLVALEAAACGTPVVAAAVGGLRSLIDDGVTGFLVEGREPADFASLVALLIENGELATTMGRNAELASRRYAWSITAARLRRMYADLLARDPVSCR